MSSAAYKERCLKVLRLINAGVEREDIADRFGVSIKNVDKMACKARAFSRVSAAPENAEPA
jgi:DNA-binding NarL/FixJ family response regulator